MHPSQVEARLEEVRTLVETRYPEYHVVDVREDSRATYQQVLMKSPKDVGPYVLARLTTEFTVEAVSLIPGRPGYRCDVVLDATGSLHIVSETFLLGFWR